MGRCPAAVRYLPIQSLFLSLLIHLTIFSVFVFTFPVYSASFKPTFVFLGSILQQEDMGTPRGQDGPAKEYASSVQDVLNAVNQELFNSSQEAVGRPFGRLVERKPVFSKPLTTNEKATLKSTFTLPALGTTAAEDATSDGLTDYETVPYNPLRLPYR